MPIGCARAAMMGAALAKFKKLYTLGVEDMAWVVGGTWKDLYAPDPVLTKEADHLYLEAGGIASGLATDSEGQFVIDAALDLTPYSTLYVDWENVGWQAADCDMWASLIASTEKSFQRNAYDARFERQMTFARQVDSVDISGLDGLFYVRVHSAIGMINNYGGGEAASIVNVYRVWLE